VSFLRPAIHHPPQHVKVDGLEAPSLQLLDSFLESLHAKELVYHSPHRLGGVDGPSASSDPELFPVHINRPLAGEEVVVDDGGERSADLPRRLEGGYAEPAKNLLDQLLWKVGLYVGASQREERCCHRVDKRFKRGQTIGASAPRVRKARDACASAASTLLAADVVSCHSLRMCMTEFDSCMRVFCRPRCPISLLGTLRLA
jgi:hypothetical protein